MHKTNSSGFTIIEVVVTLAVTSVFLLFFFQMYLAIEAQRLTVLRYTTANDVAYANLKKFSRRPPIPACSSGMDIKADPNAPGALIGGTDRGGNTENRFGFTPETGTSSSVLGAGTVQFVVAFAPAGCANFFTSPLFIVSKVFYQNNTEVVLHQAYVSEY